MVELELSKSLADETVEMLVVENPERDVPVVVAVVAALAWLI